MKSIAIFGKELNHKHRDDIIFLLNYLKSKNVEIQVYTPYIKKLEAEFGVELSHVLRFTKAKNKHNRPDLFISIGGDGTFLDSTAILRDTRIPIMGINTGRLGFLARVSSNDIKKAIDDFLDGNFELESRSLLAVETENDVLGKNNLALNEVTLHKNDNSSMIVVHAYVNGEFLNSYWADGLIVSTPTGSTAYSLSVGGPIVAPGSMNLIIAPIAPHNLNVRPMVISDDSELTLCIEGRSSKSLLSVDSKMYKIDSSEKITIKKAPYKIQLVKFSDQSFFKTLRHKLNWGLDNRN